MIMPVVDYAVNLRVHAIFKQAFLSPSRVDVDVPRLLKIHATPITLDI